MPKASQEDVENVAKGLADTEEVTLQFGEDNQVVPALGASQQSQTQASQPATAAGESPDGSGGSQDDGAKVELEDVEAALEDDDVDLSDEEEAALEELRAFLAEEREAAKKEATDEVVPKLQSSYDRQIKALNAQIKSVQDQNAAREKELLDQVREAQLNGLTDAEKAQLKNNWASEDRGRALDAREQELTSYHVELLRGAYAQEYAQFGLTEDDLVEYQTPEEMDEFVKEVQLEYYKQLAEFRAKGGKVEDEAEEPTKPKAKVAKSPAGASAPSEAGGGGAVQAQKTPETGFGQDAMYRALKDPSAWESVTLKNR